MANKKITRRALFTSVLSLLLCCSMLVGTTFAWFTDEVKSGRNTITAGNLDVELYNDSTKVDSNTELFELEAPNLWEPGVVAYENLQVRNVGTLALKYDLNLNVVDDTSVTDAESNNYKLSDVIKVGLITSKEGIAAGTLRGDVIAKVTEWKSLADFNMNMKEVALSAKTNSDVFTVVLYWEPGDNAHDNLFNMNNTNRGKELKLTIGVELFATQQVEEKDSFGSDYDNGAPLDPWGGETEDETKPFEKNAEGVWEISSPAHQAAFAKMVNDDGYSFAGETVVLTQDINMNDLPWIPIGQTGGSDSKTYFQGTFDGQSNTIYNVNIKPGGSDLHQTSGMFGFIDMGNATIKNLNINGAEINGNHWVGVIAGYMTGTVENCTVTNATINCTCVKDVNEELCGDKAGTIVGYLNQGSVINNTATNCTISAGRDAGQIVGCAAAGTTVTGNTATNVTVTNNGTCTGANIKEAHVGRQN